MNIFDRIDSYYKIKGKKDFYYTILAIVLAVGFIVFYFITPKASEFANSNEKKFNQFTQNLNQNLIALNVFKAQNIRMKRELKEMNQKITTLKKNKVYYSQLVNVVDFAQFNRQKWAQFVKNSIVDAKAQGLEVKVVKNIYDENKSMKKADTIDNFIVKKVDFGLNLEGEYKNFIYYMYKYENIKSLIRVNSFKITAPNKYYIEFSLYGYKL